MKNFIFVCLIFMLFSCAQKPYVPPKRGEPILSKNGLKTLYLGEIEGDGSGEFKTVLTKALIAEGVRVGELPDRRDGIRNFFNNLKNPNIDVKTSAYLEGSLRLGKSNEVCTSDARIRCIASVGVANLRIKRAEDNTLVMSDSFRVSVRERQTFLENLQESLFNIAFDTKRMLALKVSNKVMGGK